MCLDIDDTLSTDGKLTAPAYEALWRLKQSGLFVVPITGRPAGWCDHIARFWPVDAVVGENGAFSFFVEGGARHRLATPGAPESPRAELHRLETAIRKVFPDAQWASDQRYREYDLAIDICEDVKPWSERQVTRLLKLCAAEGAHAKLSSIHVNAWYGDYDKRKGFEHWLNSTTSPASSTRWDEWVFIGDSPNDEPLFASFAQSVGVANLKRYLPKLKAKPQRLTRAASGAGFVEFADRVLRERARGRRARG